MLGLPRWLPLRGRGGGVHVGSRGNGEAPVRRRLHGLCRVVAVRVVWIASKGERMQEIADHRIARKQVGKLQSRLNVGPEALTLGIVRDLLLDWQSPERRRICIMPCLKSGRLVQAAHRHVLAVAVGLSEVTESNYSVRGPSELRLTGSDGVGTLLFDTKIL